MIDKTLLLSQLRDIHTPTAISMWPQTFAWYLLFGFVLGIFIFVTLTLARAIVKKQRQKQALHLLAKAASAYQQNPAETLANISILLRRVALAKHQRVEIASLHDYTWLTFLDKALETKEFSEGIGQVLLTAPYQSSPSVDIEALVDLIERWIKKCLT